MRRERLLLYASLTANLVLLVLLVVGFGRLKLAETQTQLVLRESKQMAERIRELEEASRSRAPKPALNNDELLELARLRGEVTRLRKELQTAAPKTAAVLPRQTPTNTPAPQTLASTIQTLTTTLSANVGLGQALAIGGWDSPTAGKRIVGFITPDADAGSPGVVTVTTRLLEMPDAVMEQLGLQALRTDQANSQLQTLFTGDQLKAILAAAEKLPGVDVLSAPRVATASGQQAQISVREARPDGTQTGPLINLTPTLDAAGTSVRLDVGVELNLPTPARP